MALAENLYRKPRGLRFTACAAFSLVEIFSPVIRRVRRVRALAFAKNLRRGSKRLHGER
jgi:hypothetical protein